MTVWNADPSTARGPINPAVVGESTRSALALGVFPGQLLDSLQVVIPP